jgi:membrane associated rhomboid family serine protease
VPVILLRRVPPITSALIALTLALSLAAAIDRHLGGTLFYRLALVPEAVWRGQVWRLATWPLVQGGPLALIFACVSLYFFGSGLELSWGARRYRRYLAGILLIAGVGTCLIAFVLSSAWWRPHLGGMVLGDALVIAWARQFPDSPVSIYLILVVRGPALVNIVVAATLVFAIFFGLTWALPELLAVAAALIYTSRRRRRWWLEFRRRRVRRRLRVVRGGPS